MSEEIREDAFGREYSVGDIVVYAITSGRSINMIKAEVLAFLDSGSVRLQPLDGSRWGRSGETKWIDKRTGRGIDFYNEEHIEKRAHHRVIATGEEVSYEELFDRNSPWFGQMYNRSTLEYVPTKHKDYVREIKLPPRPVNIQVTKNIVLLEKRT